MFGVILIGFLLMQVVPTDPATVRAGPTATPDVIAAIRADLGLDEPLHVQFGLYMWRLLQGDLGASIINNVPVSQELAATIGPTLELMAASLVWSIPLGILMGTLAGYWRGSVIDRLIMALSVAGVSVPVFFLGLVLIWFVGFQWQLLPFTGRGGPLWTMDGIRSIILPAVTLGGVFVGPVARMTRTAVLDVLSADHVRTARAKGLTERLVVLRHALRNALVPVVTLIGLQIGFLLGGAVVTETVFSWPGVGRLAVGAILSSDFPMAQGTIIVLSLGFIVVNLTVDMLYAALDPRVRGA
nr:ABC transporter permease [Neoroseomonas nitratireducens]